MELRHVDRELGRVSADLRQARQPRVPVERGVLHALRHDHAAGLLEPLGGRMPRVGQDRQQSLDHVRELGPVPHRVLGGLAKVLGAERQVRAVHGEPREQLGDRIGDGSRLVVAGCRVDEGAVESQHLRPQDAVGDRALRAVDHRRPVRGGAAPEPGVEVGQRRLAGRVDEHAVEVAECVVARRALGGPARRHPLVALEDLLGEHVGAARLLREPLEVAARVEQSVGVVDPQAVGEPLPQPAQHLDVALVEHPRHLDADGRERVHREEATVVQVEVGAPPVHELVVLAFVHGDGVVARFRGAGCHGEAVIPVVQLEAPVGLHEAQRAEVVGAAEDGQSEPAPAEIPVDVERLGVARAAAVREHVPPPRHRGRRGHADVVRHEVGEHPHAARPCRRRRALERLGAAARRVDAGVVDDVVAVVGAGLGLEQRREVDPVGAEVVQVVHDAGDGVEVERRPHLDAVRRDGCLHR